MGPALVEIARAFDNNGQAVLGWLVDADGLFSSGLPTHTLSCQRQKGLYGGGGSCRFRFQKFL